MNYFGEEDYSENMEKVVEPFLKRHLQEGELTGERGVSLHWYALVNPYEKAAVMIVHGFCEYFGKYHEMAWYLWQAGYSVFFLEQRGHGFSGRETDNPSAVYVKDFEDYVKDQKRFCDQVVKERSKTKTVFLFAHSMGGLVGALMLEAYPDLFKKAVLSSPMLRINYGGMKPALVKLLAIWSKIAHWGKRYVPGAKDYHASEGQTDEEKQREFEKSSQGSRSRFERIKEQRRKEPHYQTSGATYGWTVASIKAAKKCEKQVHKVKTPVLILEAGNDSMVDVSGEEYFLTHTQNTTITRFPDSKHEIFNSTDENRRKFYDSLLEFYDSGDS